MHGKPKNRDVLKDWYKDNEAGERARKIMLRCEHPEMFDK